MKFITSTFVLFCAATSVFGTIIKPATTVLCTSLASAGLTNLEELGCPASLSSKVSVVPGAKEKVCLAMYNGGLNNLDTVGCDATMFSKRGRSCSNSDFCEYMSTSLLLDTSLFNCNNRGRFKRRHEDDDEDCSASICKLMSTALITVSAFNCNS
ncbi:hypothetical protein A4X09_0g4015 [Tilletia walkeri]|uniref:Cyanovirin-N domain-containing protein n=1 Tax=Tilletia walkeri TaxID=117179 RepID=A0A8X7N9K8_9BASI|nr:hypothetical protein A4X09_0g4015 [Tilletia walkeri]